MTKLNHASRRHVMEGLYERKNLTPLTLMTHTLCQPMTYCAIWQAAIIPKRVQPEDLLIMTHPGANPAGGLATTRCGGGRPAHKKRMAYSAIAGVTIDICDGCANLLDAVKCAFLGHFSLIGIDVEIRFVGAVFTVCSSLPRRLFRSTAKS